MGPTILFDKSAIHGLGDMAVTELSRYFYTVIPPVLLMETLADLSLHPDDLDRAKRHVARIANKLYPCDAIANVHYHTLCLGNLLGYKVPMARKAVIHGATSVTAPDGSRGIVIGTQPESDAVQRWRRGDVSTDDLKFANDWRKAAWSTNIEEMKRQVPGPPIQLKTPQEVQIFVDALLTDPDLQRPLLCWFMGLLRLTDEMQNSVLVRWKFAVSRTLAAFAPYARHCLRVQLIYYVGMIQGVFSTRASNIVDLEYLHYSPFSHIICAEDNFLKTIAPLVIDDDQCFVSSKELKTALDQLVVARQSDPNARPTDGSLIQRLWSRHWHRSITPIGRECLSAEDAKALMEEVRPIIDAIEAATSTETRGRFPV